MAETMTRRTFLKGAAAAAVAVSLAGCGGGSTVGEFRVYFNGNPEFGWMISGDYGFVKLNIGIKAWKTASPSVRSTVMSFLRK